MTSPFLWALWRGLYVVFVVACLIWSVWGTVVEWKDRHYHWNWKK